MLGYYMKRSDTDMTPLFTVLFLFCFSVVPLKKIEEVEEDEKSGYRNLYSEFGLLLLLWPLCGLSLVFLLLYVFDLGNTLEAFVLIITISSAACVLIFRIFKAKLYLLYQTIIYTVIVEGIIFYVVL
jgi:4-hydroxybenzoate polyprenyltransferase